MPSSAQKKELLLVPGNLSVIFSSCESSKMQHVTQSTLIKAVSKAKILQWLHS